MKHIEKLLGKYYNGETSFEEERQLQDFFQGEDIPDYLESHEEEFAFYRAMAQSKAPLTDDELFAKLDQKLAAPKVVKVDWFKNQWLGKIAAGLVLLLVGYLASELLQRDTELEDIRMEMAQMKKLMFEQLESPSASGRLQAVSNSLSMTSPDDEIVAALIETMNFDENMHVRSKAVEALANFGENPMVGKALSEALSVEEEPAVQIAMINALVELKDAGAILTLEKLSDNEHVLQDVQGEARLGIFKLKEL